MTRHVLMIRPPRSLNAWSPWVCVMCNVGGCGANDRAAEWQFDLHVRGLWPAFVEPHPNATEAVVIDSEHGPITVWVKEVPPGEHRVAYPDRDDRST